MHGPPRIEALPATLAPRDHDDVCALLVAAFGACDRGRAMCGEVAVVRRFVTRDEGGRIVGHQAVKALDSPGLTALGLGDLVVAPDHRGRGHARGLIAAACAHARAQADLVVTLTDVVHGMFAALGFAPAAGRLRIAGDDATPVRDAWIWERHPSDSVHLLHSARF